MHKVESLHKTLKLERKIRQISKLVLCFALILQVLLSKSCNILYSAGWKVEKKEKVEYGIFRGRCEIQLAA